MAAKKSQWKEDVNRRNKFLGSRLVDKESVSGVAKSIIPGRLALIHLAQYVTELVCNIRVA